MCSIAIAVNYDICDVTRQEINRMRLTKLNNLAGSKQRTCCISIEANPWLSVSRYSVVFQEFVPHKPVLWVISQRHESAVVIAEKDARLLAVLPGARGVRCEQVTPLVILQPRVWWTGARCVGWSRWSSCWRHYISISCRINQSLFDLFISNTQHQIKSLQGHCLIYHLQHKFYNDTWIGWF